MPGSFLEDDLTSLFASPDFGEADGTVTWAGVTISGGIFDDEDIELQLGEGVTEIAHQARFTGPSAEFVGIRDNDPMTIRGRQFRVKNWKDDGTGVIEIFLEER